FISTLGIILGFSAGFGWFRVVAVLLRFRSNSTLLAIFCQYFFEIKKATASAVALEIVIEFRL
ncbi:MAG: hypothetical protein WCP97_10115, partial [bacterium]